MELTLGPVYFNWPAEKWRDFYYRIADEAPVDNVVIGEVVCSKRLPFIDSVIPAAIERLERAGKAVSLASLALVTLERERRMTAELAAAEGMTVEANDLSCLTRLDGRPHAIGPLVQVYNEAAAAFFAGGGAVRICLPPELPAASIAAIAKAVPETAIEVFAFGRAPLAISARCYHARAAGLSKDNCRFVCENDPDGMPVKTLDGESFVVVNGVQTLGHACTNLILDLDMLTAIGVAAARLSPQTCDMIAVARTFRDVLDRRIASEEGAVRLSDLYRLSAFCNGFLHGREGAAWLGVRALA